MRSWQEALSREIRRLQLSNPVPRVVVVGVGHELRGDDGAGPAIARALRDAAVPGLSLHAIEGGHAPENITARLRRLAPDLVLFVDVAQMDEPPATIKWLPWEETAGLSASTHTLPLHLLACYLVEALKCEVALIGIQPADLSLDTGLTPAVQAAAAEVVEGILSIHSPERATQHAHHAPETCEAHYRKEAIMERDFLAERRKALEETFFAEHNEKLLAQLRARHRHMQQRDALAAASGIHDENVLEEMMRLNFTSETVSSLALVPLLVVAWADGEVTAEEREAILAAAAETWLPPDSEGYFLLEHWLHQIPSPELIHVWTEYITALATVMSPEAMQQVREETLLHARKVAEAAGGFLGFNRISDEEQAALEQLARILQQEPAEI